MLFFIFVFIIFVLMKIKNITSKDAELILSKSGISRTKFRTNLLNLFIDSNKSLSVDEIMDFFENSINKVTVYRSLDCFENKGIIHKVADSKNHKRYSLCNDQCNINSHNHAILYVTHVVKLLPG